MRRPGPTRRMKRLIFSLSASGFRMRSAARRRAGGRYVFQSGDGDARPRFAAAIALPGPAAKGESIRQIPGAAGRRDCATWCASRWRRGESDSQIEQFLVAQLRRLHPDAAAAAAGHTYFLWLEWVLRIRKIAGLELLDLAVVSSVNHLLTQWLTEKRQPDQAVPSLRYGGYPDAATTPATGSMLSGWVKYFASSPACVTKLLDLAIVSSVDAISFTLHRWRSSVTRQSPVTAISS